MLGTSLLQRVTRDLGGMGARCVKRSNRALLCTLACILSNSLGPMHHLDRLRAWSPAGPVMSCVFRLCAAARVDGAGFSRTYASGPAPSGDREFDAVCDESSLASTASGGPSSPRERIRTCYDVFFAICHSDTAWGHAFDRLRQRRRCRTRRRAMGRSSIRVDVDLGMCHLLWAIGFLQDIHRDFVRGRTDASLWTEEQLLRAVFRWGLVARWWPYVVTRWPCATPATRLVLATPLDPPHCHKTHTCDMHACTGCVTLAC